MGKYTNDGVESRQRHACAANARPAVDSEALRLTTLLHLRVFPDEELGGRLEHSGEAFNLWTFRELEVYDRELYVCDADTVDVEHSNNVVRLQFFA